MDSKAAMLGSAESVLKTIAEEQITAVGKEDWNQQIHQAAICRLAAAIFEADLKGEKIRRFFSLLADHGFGGNASQFRQWLEDHGDKGAAVLPAKEKKAKAIADSLLA